MGNVVNTNISSGRLKFTFTDDDGEVFSFFRMNPADVNLAKRCKEVANEMDKTPINLESVEDAAAFDKLMGDKICYILGYNAKEDVFGEITASTILPSGDVFALVVLDAIGQAVQPEIEKRANKMAGAVSKYTSKYGA